jgi:hypothetical protein
MSRAPAAKPVRPSSRQHCLENDCQRQQAQALTRLADHFDHLFGLPGAEPDDQGEAMKALITIGEIGGKWLRFCAFVRKWFPRVGWWLLPILATLLTKGSSEAVDALVKAATLALQNYAATGG